MTNNVEAGQAERDLEHLVACTLSDTDLKTQRQRWMNLGENFGISRTADAEGLRLTFRQHAAVEAELRALVAVENECCAWAIWRVERDHGGELAMVVRSQGEGVQTLHTMFVEPCFDGAGRRD